VLSISSVDSAVCVEKAALDEVQNERGPNVSGQYLSPLSQSADFTERRRQHTLSTMFAPPTVQ
jgi:hypothetical protein